MKKNYLPLIVTVLVLAAGGLMLRFQHDNRSIQPNRVVDSESVSNSVTEPEPANLPPPAPNNLAAGNTNAPPLRAERKIPPAATTQKKPTEPTRKTEPGKSSNPIYGNLNSGTRPLAKNVANAKPTPKPTTNSDTTRPTTKPANTRDLYGQTTETSEQQSIIREPPLRPDVTNTTPAEVISEPLGSNKTQQDKQPEAPIASLADPSAGNILDANAFVVQDSTKPTARPTPKKKQPLIETKPNDKFKLAAQPKMGDQWQHEEPQMDRRAWQVDSIRDDFAPDPIDPFQPYDANRNIEVYDGKQLNANQRPLVELGRPWYQLGQLSQGSSILGFHNPVTPQFILFGDYRTAVASNTNRGGDNTSLLAWELNLNFNLQLTGTERFHMFIAPLDDGKNTRYLFDDDHFDEEFDADIDFGYFEGDLGAITGGLIGETLPFDLPFALGVMPLLAQNGVWLEDAFLGVAATIPARNSPLFDISNMDITFFAGYDEINSPAFEADDDAAKLYGMMSFIESMNGYWEIDYAYLEDRNFRDRSYHNIGIAFSRRFGRFISNSTRLIINAGQSNGAGPNTADGVLLLSENSLITGAPSTVVPYLNFFAGFDRPQSAARAGAAGGVLRNTGILFETDGMTGYPTLDATANETYGAAFGLNVLPNDFSQQLVLETAMLGVMGDDPNRNAKGDQYGLGFRYQLPLTNAIILRADGMLGFLRAEEDIRGMRLELRHKF